MQQGTTFKECFSWRPAGRFLFIAFATFALFLQSYAIQTHLHQRSNAAVTASIQGSQTDKHHLPAGNDDPDNCPLCQSFYSGQYVAPNLAAWFLPILAVSIIDVTSAVSPHYDTVSHSWRGRGPPHN
jgi:hypothetical protein